MARDFTVKQIHKQRHPYTYGFGSDINGSAPTGWTDADGVDCASTIIAVLDGHRKVLQLYDNSAAAKCDISRSITQQADQTIELWLAKSSIAASKDCYMELEESGTRIIYLRLQDNDLDYYDGAWKSIKDDFIAASTLLHIRVVLDDTANTFDCYVNGILEGSGLAYENNSITSVDTIQFTTGTGDTGYYFYIADIGLSADANYKIGDNMVWRHFKMSDDPFLNDDIGAQGTSITWVDAVDTTASFELTPEFNACKKALRGYYSSGVGGYDNAYHSFDTQAKDGWVEFLVKVSDATIENRIMIREDVTDIIALRIFSDRFQYYDKDAAGWVDLTTIPSDNTWYHIHAKWTDAAQDLINLWIDNIKELTDIKTVLNQTSGVNRMQINCYSATQYIYIAAVNCSLDSESPERADNRTFAYHTYTGPDVTTDIINVTYANKIYAWREAMLFSRESYDAVSEFFEVYDINSKLVIIGEIQNRVQNGAIYSYTLADKNKDDLKNINSHTFSAAKIHADDESGCMLKTILPNISHEDGDLLLVEADSKATTYSPTTKNYPDYMFLRDLADLADSCIIIEASGKVYLDDDKASGTALNLATAADKDKMTAEPIINDILETINYFEIFGDINPDTGVRFYKITDNSGTDKKRRWRYTNNNFKSQADVDAYAAALIARISTIKIITIRVQGVGIHDMGTTLDYQYSDGEAITIAQANYYIIEERWNADISEHIIVLSEGMIEESKFAADYEREVEYTDGYAEGIYDTDIISISLERIPRGGATETIKRILLNANGEYIQSVFYLPKEVDESRIIKLILIGQRNDANADTIGFDKYLNYQLSDNDATTFSIIWNWVSEPWLGTKQNAYRDQTITIPANTLPSDCLVNFWYKMTEASRSIYIDKIILQYYIRRL